MSSRISVSSCNTCPFSRGIKLCTLAYALGINIDIRDAHFSDTLHPLCPAKGTIMIEYGGKPSTDNYCDDCNNGSGNCAYPMYGFAPYRYVSPTIMGSTEFIDKSEWPACFQEDPNIKNFGKYTHCPSCGRSGEAK